MIVFPYMGNVIIPTDKLVFFGGVGITNQNMKAAYSPSDPQKDTVSKCFLFTIFLWQYVQYRVQFAALAALFYLFFLCYPWGF